MAKKFDEISKNNKNINFLANIFSDDDLIETPKTVETSITPVTSVTLKDINKKKRREASISIVDKKTIETSKILVTPVTPVTQDTVYVRQTVIVATDDLDLLKNMVYTKRLEGKVNYTQKEALRDVIAFFRVNHSNIKERSQEVKDEEFKRSENIIKGKR
jgi:hypothetical protein